MLWGKVVTVDRDTGQVRLEKIVAVDDCGNAINPLLVEGQIVGDLAQSIGQALLEHVRYDGRRSASDRNVLNLGFGVDDASHYSRSWRSHRGAGCASTSN